MLLENVRLYNVHDNRQFIKSPMDALPFSTCFWATQRQLTPLRCAQSDTNSSGSEQEFPKIAQPVMHNLIKQAEPALDSSPTAVAPCPGDLEQLIQHLWGSLYDSIKSL